MVVRKKNRNHETINICKLQNHARESRCLLGTMLSVSLSVVFSKRCSSFITSSLPEQAFKALKSAQEKNLTSLKYPRIKFFSLIRVFSNA